MTRRAFGSWRLVRRLFAIVLGVYLGVEAGYWWHSTPDRSPWAETIDYMPRCR